MTLTLAGNNNYGKPRQDFANKVGESTDDEFVKIAEQYIWLSAYASNNPRSDYHWIADACYDEAVARGKLGLYERAWKIAAS